MDQMGQKFKTVLLSFPKWLFFQPNFGGKCLKIGHCVPEIWLFHWWSHNRTVQSWFLRKRLSKFGNLLNVLGYLYSVGQIQTTTLSTIIYLVLGKWTIENSVLGGMLSHQAHVTQFWIRIGCLVPTCPAAVWISSDLIWPLHIAAFRKEMNWYRCP